MIRDTIDVYLSCIDSKKVHLVLQFWFVSFLTAFVDVSLTASGYEPWDPPTFMVVWLAVFVTLEGLATLGATFFSFWIAGRRLQQMARHPAQGPSPHLPDASWEDPDGFWDDLPDDEGVSHD